MTHIFRPERGERQKWRAQAERAAAHLKKTAFAQETIAMGFAFDDGFVKVTLRASSVREKSESELADMLEKLVLDTALAGTTPQGSA
jgi:hypothetical protein